MEWNLPETERTYLRELARKQAAYAALPVMAQRKRMWNDLNDGLPGARPPVVIETWTFDRDFLPASVFRCTSALGRRIEGQLLRNLRNHELIDDDKVMPDFFEIGWFTDIDELGVKIESETIPDSQGINTGYAYHYAITDMDRDLEKLKPAVCKVDKPRTLAYQAFLTELFDGLLPVQITTGTFGCAMLTQRVIQLMGMEAFFMAMYDTPDKVHELMAFLRDNCLRVMHWAESEGLLRVNNGNQQSFGTSYNFTHTLPAADFRGPAARLCDMWSAANSQETVGISTPMFNEFGFPYYRDVCAPMGRLYYGCCEPSDTFWEDIRRLPHLSKVSVNRWTNERFMGAALAGSGIVFSRKPDPNLLGVHEALDESAWSSHIRQTLEATRGTLLEIIIRDVYTVHGNLNKPRRAVELARQEIDRHYRR